MAKIYYRQIKAGVMALEQVPLRWKEAVEAMLAAEEG